MFSSLFRLGKCLDISYYPGLRLKVLNSVESLKWDFDKQRDRSLEVMDSELERIAIRLNDSYEMYLKNKDRNQFIKDLKEALSSYNGRINYLLS